MTVTRASLADRIFTHIGLSKKEARDFVTIFFDELNQSFLRGENVKLLGFGKFEVRQKAERIGRNPATGEEAIISQRQVVVFRPAQKLKKLVKEYVHKPPPTDT